MNMNDRISTKDLDIVEALRAIGFTRRVDGSCLTLSLSDPEEFFIIFENTGENRSFVWNVSQDDFVSKDFTSLFKLMTEFKFMNRSLCDILQIGMDQFKEDTLTLEMLDQMIIQSWPGTIQQFDDRFVYSITGTEEEDDFFLVNDSHAYPTEPWTLDTEDAGILLQESTLLELLNRTFLGMRLGDICKVNLDHYNNLANLIKSGTLKSEKYIPQGSTRTREEKAKKVSQDFDAIFHSFDGLFETLFPKR